MDSHIPAKKAKYDSFKTPEVSGDRCIDDIVQDETGKDLWADNEFTAEEFDLLQSQVSSQALHPGTSHNKDPMINEVEKLKEQNYGLEGKIKMLQNALEKNSKELDKERLEKMNLMEKYSEQQKQQQKLFEKEKECLKTRLLFKEQELQASFGKIKVLEQKDKTTACSSKTCNVKSTGSSKVADISKDAFGTLRGTKPVVQKTNVMVQTESKEVKLTHRLKLWYKKDSVTDLVTSNMLCRAGDLFPSTDGISHEEKILQKINEGTGNISIPFRLTDAKSYTKFTRIALSRLNIEKGHKLMRDNIFPDRLPSFRILHLLQQVLKECLNIMNGIINGAQQTPSLSWSSILHKDWSRINILLNSQKFPLSTAVMEEVLSLLEQRQVMVFQYLYHLLSLEAVRSILFFNSKRDQIPEMMQKFNEKCERNEKSIHPLIDIVLTASTPLFYEGKCINKSAVEWSLAVLIKSAEYCRERFDSYLPDISVCGITSGKCSLTSSWLLLHLLQYLLPFEFLTNHIGRHSSLCIYHSLLELCERIGKKDLGEFEMKIMTLVLNVLSGLLSNHKSLLDGTMGCLCLHKLFNVVMKILNAEIKLYTYMQSKKHFLFLQNGMSSLNWLRQLRIFQDQFANNQPVYISLWNDSSLLKTQLSIES